MKFFKRLWLAKCENQNSEKETYNGFMDNKFKIFINGQTKLDDVKYDKLQENSDNLQKWLEQNNNEYVNREIVSPDEFFTSPDAVKLYQEEKMMSTWIILDLDCEDDENLEKAKHKQNNKKSLAMIKGKPIFTTYDKECFQKSLMGPMLEPIFVSASGVSHLLQNKKGLNIQQTFGLNDNGSLLVNLDHILICKGTESLHYKFSFFSSCENGIEITHEYRIRRNFSLLRNIIDWIKNLLGTFSFDKSKCFMYHNFRDNFTQKRSIKN